ncbi:hypothetical protein VKT23_010093 [Stygiomarasmius scandens]|uniref:DUF7330 domain-containing protein n=1 Tax=Marasmiellus scandens TaxID=2682957 RepID=A0ABR1JCM1_9AGAR
MVGDPLPPPPYAGIGMAKFALSKRIPSNYMTIVREKGPIKAEFSIDPTLTVHESLLPGLSDGETKSNRNNLNVKALSDEIDIDVHLQAGANQCSEEPEVKINVQSLKGDVVIRLHVPVSDNLRRRCHLNVTANNGSIFLLLPETYAGLINVTAKGQMIVSDDLSSHLNIQSETGRTRRCIVGNVLTWQDIEKKKKDETVAWADRGRVYLQYNSETFEKPRIGWFESL